MNGSPVHSLVRRTPLDGSLVLLLLGGLLGYIVSYDRSLSGCALVTLFVGIAIYYARPGWAIAELLVDA